MSFIVDYSITKFQINQDSVEVWKLLNRYQRFIESQDIPETENTLGLDGGETKLYVYIQSTTKQEGYSVSIR
jgi:NADH:ubiquinone oxidoreductase subunit D